MNQWQEKVWTAAEGLRARHLQGELARLPVDVFSLAELELRLDVIPFDDLFAKFEVDAAIALAPIRGIAAVGGGQDGPAFRSAFTDD